MTQQDEYDARQEYLREEMEWRQIQDEMHSRPVTGSEALREFGNNCGYDNPDTEWLLSDWDVWVRNPYYSGPRGPHPEEYCGEEGADF